MVQLHFNTSHVTVYLPVLPTEISTPQISIHLMLLFIFIREEYLTEEANFNTSHVTVYQKDWTAKVADSTISIHLMLLFIEEDHNKITGAKRISIHLMLLFIRQRAYILGKMD